MNETPQTTAEVDSTTGNQEAPALRHDLGRGTTNGQGRAVWFGNVERLADLFTSVEPRAFGDETRTIKTYAPYSRKDGPGAILTDYATIEINGYRLKAARVTPTAAVVGVIDSQMIHPGRDSISFKVIEWSDGRALVTADNSQIIGGVWLAFLAPSVVAELREAVGA